MGKSAPEVGESIWSLVAFWLIAFTAAVLFAAVLIAPKWEQRARLMQRVCELADTCRSLEEGNEQLEQIIEAFKHDPEFTGELARSELDYGLPGERRVPAPARHWNASKPTMRRPEPADPWAPILRLFAHDTLVRHMALLTAAVFAVVGLAFFQPPARSET